MASRPSASVEIVAHRGFAALFPENTMLAFQRALELGAHTIELDIHHSKEGVPVVIHDDSLNRTTTRTGLIRNLSLQDIRLADAGVKFGPQFVGCHVPLLEEALDLCSGRARLQLELKENISEAAGKALLHLLKMHDMLEHTMIISFAFSNLKLIRELNREMELGFLISSSVPLASVQELGYATCCFNQSLVLKKPAIVNQVQALGLDIAAWTIRDEPTAKKLYDLGIRRLTSDIPLKEALFHT